LALKSNDSSPVRLTQAPNLPLDSTGLKHDPMANCMRIILAHGKVNIFNLA
jgi:hypothetical protein